MLQNIRIPLIHGWVFPKYVYVEKFKWKPDDLDAQKKGYSLVEKYMVVLLEGKDE